MATVRNNTARQFNLKVMLKGSKIIVVRIVPGLNTVDDSAWKEVSKLPFFKELIDNRSIESGREVENAVLSEDPAEAKVVTKPVSKKAQKARAELNAELAAQ